MYAWTDRNSDKPHRCPTCHRVAERAWLDRGYGPRTVLRCTYGCGLRWRAGVRSHRVPMRWRSLWFERIRVRRACFKQEHEYDVTLVQTDTPRGGEFTRTSTCTRCGVERVQVVDSSTLRVVSSSFWFPVNEEECSGHG